ncbi:MAG: isopentenyl phosphate kinase [Candidatus Diapherotrites archaeon]|nr:isopentenyl phosphate kinase [Candidatus Diapherotrites archaeon]
MNLYIIKIGGSVCTDKAGNKFIVRKEIVQRIAQEIKQAQKQKKFKLIIVHGAGPFGHTLVKQYKLTRKIKTKQQIQGVLKVQESTQTLNQTIVKLFKKQGMKITGLPTHALVIQSNKKIKQFELQPVKELLKQNQVPCLYGDMVVDTKLGASVVSGDAIVPWLAKKLKAKKVFYGTDVDGIYAQDPKQNPKAELLKVINKHNYSQALRKLTGSLSTDVTGGMKGKVEKMHKDLKGIPTTIFNMNPKQNTYQALMGKLTECTQVKL